MSDSAQDPGATAKPKRRGNRIPKTAVDLAARTREIKKGLETKQDALGLRKNSATVLDATLVEFEQAQQAYQTVLADRAAALYPAFHRAQAEGKAFLDGAVKLLRMQLGNTWSQAWVEAGQLNASTAIPTKAGAREGLIKNFASYLGADPVREAPNQGVTASRAAAVHQAILDAKAKLRDNQTQQGHLKAARNDAERKLRQTLRRTMVELEMVLERDSPDWSNFGLEPPARADERKRANRKQAASPIHPENVGPLTRADELAVATNPPEGMGKVLVLAQ